MYISNGWGFQALMKWLAFSQIFILPKRLPFVCRPSATRGPDAGTQGYGTLVWDIQGICQRKDGLEASSHNLDRRGWRRIAAVQHVYCAGFLLVGSRCTHGKVLKPEPK